MPAYSFKKQFIPFIQDGTKCQTIRKRSKKLCRPGDTVYLYYGLRTKHCEYIAEHPCIAVKTIIIKQVGDDLLVSTFAYRIPDGEIPFMVNEKLHHHSTEVLDMIAWEDGFRAPGSTEYNNAGCWELMKKWWMENHEFPFVGDIIYW